MKKLQLRDQVMLLKCSGSWIGLKTGKKLTMLVLRTTIF
ncbi:hypothetical protein ACHAXN_000170 [Cyclotella atomus]